jgi:hypothetical protein
MRCSPSGWLAVWIKRSPYSAILLDVCSTSREWPASALQSCSGIRQKSLPHHDKVVMTQEVPNSLRALPIDLRIASIQIDTRGSFQLLHSMAVRIFSNMACINSGSDVDGFIINSASEKGIHVLVQADQINGLIKQLLQILFHMYHLKKVWRHFHHNITQRFRRVHTLFAPLTPKMTSKGHQQRVAGGSPNTYSYCTCLITGRTTSQTASGCLAATCSRIRAEPCGVRRPCSQFCNVLILMPNSAANSLCDNLYRSRIRLTSGASISNTRDG